MECWCITQHPDPLLFPGWPHSSVPGRQLILRLRLTISLPVVTLPRLTATLTFKRPIHACTCGVTAIELHPAPSSSSLLLPRPPHRPEDAAELAREGRRGAGKREEEVPQEGERQPPTTLVGKVGGLRLWGRGWRQGREGFSL